MARAPAAQARPETLNEKRHAASVAFAGPHCTCDMYAACVLATGCSRAAPHGGGLRPAPTHAACATSAAAAVPGGAAPSAHTTPHGSPGGAASTVPAYGWSVVARRSKRHVGGGASQSSETTA